MDLSTFLQKRRPLWRELENSLQRVEGSGLEALDDEQAVRFGVLYRTAASDLNQAQTFVSGDATVQYLNDLVARCYMVIYGRSRTDVLGLLRYLCWGYPAVFRRYVSHFLLATAIFAAGTGFGYLAAYFDPLTARSFLLPTEMSMIQPDQESPLLTSGELAAGASFYFTHNTSVSLVTLALGLTFGIGTAWIVWYTGIITGALLAVFVEAGQFTAFCTGILPHGVLEIPAFLIASAAGFLLAQGMIRARPWPRLQELARCGKEALFLFGGCVPLLAMAGMLEIGVARVPERYLGEGVKLAVAGVFALLFAAYVLLFGWEWIGQAVRKSLKLNRPHGSAA
jgi:uncharacterized membrane protein SpoIIM required for sporulation